MIHEGSIEESFDLTEEQISVKKNEGYDLKDKLIIFEAPLLPHEEDKPDRNGNIWPKAVLEKAFNEALNREQGLSVCFRPEGQDFDNISDFLTIDPESVVGQVLDYSSEKNTIHVEINDHLPGFKELTEDFGLKPGIRATCDVKPDGNGNRIIQDDLTIVALDMVK